MASGLEQAAVGVPALYQLLATKAVRVIGTSGDRLKLGLRAAVQGQMRSAAASWTGSRAPHLAEVVRLARDGAGTGAPAHCRERATS